MADLGKAYVQIIPSAEGISGKISEILEPEAKKAGDSAGKSGGFNLGSQLVNTVKTIVATAAIGKFIGDSLTAGGDLQQSLGGVETLFKGSAETVKNYARTAFKDAGVSANEYMEQVTSFSASLIQSLGGDTAKAAEMANMAVVDMSDNANKMGTDLVDIQNAYQGFAKQNYTMLDNLKLGYGGTREEMQRLLDDANELNAQAGKHTDYQMDNFADIVSAIHDIQEEMNITGTTAKEATETFTGSLGMVKAAWTDFLAGLSTGFEELDLTQTMNNLAFALSSFVFDNLLPMIMNIVEALPMAIQTFVDAAVPFIQENGGKIIESLVIGISEALPALIIAAADIITALVNGFIENKEVLIQGFMQILEAIKVLFTTPEVWQAMGVLAIGFLSSSLISNGIQAIAGAVTKWLGTLLASVMGWQGALIALAVLIVGWLCDWDWNKFKDAAKKAIDWIVNGIKSLWGKVKAVGKETADKVVNGIKSTYNSIVSAGADLVRGFWEGIKSLGGWIRDKVMGFFSNIVNGVKSFLRIGSPSKLFAEYGEWTIIGYANGIEDEADKPIEAFNSMVDEMLETAYNTDIPLELDSAYSVSASAIGDVRVSENSKIDSMLEYLAMIAEKDTDVYIDGERAGAILNPILERDRFINDKYNARRAGEFI